MREVVDYVDGKTQTKPAGVSDDDIAYVRKARNVVNAETGHVCFIPVYSNNKELAKDFLLSIDAYQYGENLIMFPDELTEFYEKGGAVAWGIVPSSNDLIESETVDSLVERMESIFSKMEEKGINRQKAAAQSLITPQCGLGLVEIHNVDKVFDLMKGVSEKLKERYGFQ